MRDAGRHHRAATWRPAWLLIWLAVGTLGACAGAMAGPSNAGTSPASQVCGAPTDDRLRPIPPALAPAVIAAFGAHMTPAEVERNGVIRCADGAVLACLAGANLNCGQADTSRQSQGGDAWCKAHPDADFVPMFATGHATVFDWRCAGHVAVPTGQVERVDPRGFVAGNWRRID